MNKEDTIILTALCESDQQKRKKKKMMKRSFSQHHDEEAEAKVILRIVNSFMFIYLL